MTKIKICGITRESETEVLNRMQVDYAGFVFFEKSKRNVSIEQAKEIKKHLKSSIKTVAVTVNPALDLIDEIIEAGFDILQIHKMQKFPENLKIPVWVACQVRSREEAEEINVPDGISGILLDAPEFGSGKTFSWQDFPMKKRREWQERRIPFILAGGLSSENVEEGIRLFEPDVVDVSSSVEGEHGKDHKKVEAFVRKVREHE